MIYILLVCMFGTLLTGFFAAKEIGFNNACMFNFCSACACAFMAGTYL